MPGIIDLVSPKSEAPEDLSRRRALEYRVVMGVAVAWVVLASGIAYVIEKRMPSKDPGARSAKATFQQVLVRSRAERVPVIYKNPFDPTEVFEFPPGTREADAHQAVAQLLLERARERLGYMQPLQRTASVTAISDARR